MKKTVYLTTSKKNTILSFKKINFVNVQRNCQKDVYIY